MAKSVLIVYEPLDTFKENRAYWSSYVDFYENYWGGPSTPHSVSFGSDYKNFRQSLSRHLGIGQENIEDCFFIKDEGGRYYICPFGSQVNPYILSSENYIPTEWFLLFKDEERKFFYTHTGFGSIHYDGIYYNTGISLGLGRLKEANNTLENVFLRYQGKNPKLPILHKLNDIQYGVQNLETWLSGFDPEGRIILNYGDICSFIHSYTMENERSVKEIWEVLSLLSKDRIEDARLVLDIMTRKWEEIRSKASGNIDKSLIQ